MLKQIKRELQTQSTPEAREATLKFVPGTIPTYGVRMPVINDLAKRYRSGGFPLIIQLWKENTFEERMLACRMLIYVAKLDPAQAIKVVKRFGKQVSDWAICDCLGTQSLKRIHKTHLEEIFELSSALVLSKRLWERRLGLVLLVNYSKTRKLQLRIKSIMKSVASDDNYYVKKAIVWLNRNIAKSR